MSFLISFLKITFFSILLLGFFSEAKAFQETPSVLIYAYPLNWYIRYDKNENQELRRFDPRVFGVGLDFKKIEISFELTQFDSSTQSGNLTIRREEQETHFWGRMSFWSWNSLNFYSGLAIGSYNELIRSTLGSAVSEKTSQWNWSAGAAVGFKVDINQYLLSSFEIRTIFGKDFDPQPQFAGLLRLGLRF